MTAPSHSIERAREVAEFCLARGGACFAGWPAKTLFAYCFFHLVDRGVFIVRAHGQIAALMFAWGIPEDEIRQTFADRQAAFQWRRSRDHVDAIFLAEVIGDRRRLPRLFKLASAKWPGWRGKKVFTYRSGGLVELPVGVIERMVEAPSAKRLAPSALCPDTGGADASLCAQGPAP